MNQNEIIKEAITKEVILYLNNQQYSQEEIVDVILAIKEWLGVALELKDHLNKGGKNERTKQQ